MIPLSFQQRGLWFIHQMEGPSATYNITEAIRLSGRLDTVALQAAFRDLVARHETLRTIFPDHEGEPYQHVLGIENSDFRLEIRHIDEARLTETVAAAGRYGFDLAREVPFRGWLLVLGPENHVLVMLMHHIITDGWSAGPLTRDLTRAYAARCQGVAPDWEALPVQYSDYTLWQRDLLGSDDAPDSVVSRQLAYWRRTLDGLPEELRLPADRPRPHVPSRRGGVVTLEVGEETCRSLRALARDTQATLYMTLQAALAVLLSRLGAGTDIPIGVPLAGRTDDALNDLIGYFISTVVVRIDLSEDPTFRDILARVRSANLGAYENQDLPFERLVELLNPPRSPARHPLFQVMLGFEARAEASLELPGLTATALDTHSDGAMFDLNIDLFETAGNITGFISYAADLFDHRTAGALRDRLLRVLAAVARDPDQPVSRIDALLPAEQHQVVEAWNQTDAPTAGGTVPDLFEAQVARMSAAPALETGDGTVVSYGELNGRANQLARYLVRHGTRAESIVAVCLPRSPQLLVALLAALKAGAGYLAVDPEYPAERIDAMLAGAAPACLVAQDASRPGPGGAAYRVVLEDPAVSRELEALPSQDLSDDERATPLYPGNIAYLIYTSGSTGEPKGVVVTHRSLVNYLAWSLEACRGLAGTTLLHTSISHDFTITTFLSPLVAGGRIRLADVTADGRTEIASADVSSCSFLKVTPSHLPLLGSLPGRPAPSAQLMLCGEPLTAGAVAEWQEQHPSLQVVNAYGPTEATVESSWYEVDPPGKLRSPLVPIGRPARNTRTYVLDEVLRPVPVGVTGELYVAGHGVARGYLGRPMMTAERFVACPFGPRGERMYRTGDTGRWRADGQLEYSGRTDDQINVRGHRVEPGEIVAILEQHPDVAQTAVVARADLYGDIQLVAYVVPSAGREVHLDDLRSHLAAVLPGYMIPAIFVMLASMPLTKNGKVDRQALPEPAPLAAVADDSAPGTPEEELLCGLFAGLLGLPRVGIHTSFFTLGGNSLLAARLVFKLRQRQSGEITVGMVFAHPSVAELARALAGGSAAGAEPATTSALTLDALLNATGGEESVAERLRRAGGASPRLETDGSPGHIILTGSTGYFGCFLLDELLNQTDAAITCLVRAQNEAHARERVRQALARFDRWSPAAQARVSAVPGDLSQPRLGMSEPGFARLAESADSIYHCGAEVNLLQSFEVVRAANIDGTRELIRLATETRVKSLHLISTDARLGTYIDIAGPGYVPSKRIAERLVMKARENGLPASIYRMPRLSLDSRTGRGNPRDAGLRMLQVVLRHGVAPDADFREMWIPVDEAAKLVISASLRRLDGGLFSVVTPETGAWRNVLEVAREAGHHIAFKTVTEWADLVRAADSVEDEVVLGLLDTAGGLDLNDPHAGPVVLFEDPAGFGEQLVGSHLGAPVVRQYIGRPADGQREDRSR